MLFIQRRMDIPEWNTSRDFLCLEGYSVDHRVGIDESGTFGFFHW
jgi:hypothetical protein